MGIYVREGKRPGPSLIYGGMRKDHWTNTIEETWLILGKLALLPHKAAHPPTPFYLSDDIISLLREYNLRSWSFPRYLWHEYLTVLSSLSFFCCCWKGKSYWGMGVHKTASGVVGVDTKGETSVFIYLPSGPEGGGQEDEEKWRVNFLNLFRTFTKIII